MGAPYPGPGSLEEGDKDSCLSIELGEPNHCGVCAGVQEEESHGLPVSLQDCGDMLQENWVGGKHGTHVLEGVGKMRLEGWTFSRQ